MLKMVTVYGTITHDEYGVDRDETRAFNVCVNEDCHGCGLDTRERTATIYFDCDNCGTVHVVRNPE